MTFLTMDRVAPKISGAVLIYSLAHGAINVLWLARRGGAKSAIRAGLLGTGLPALAEVWITSLDKLLSHRMEPRVLGVPVAIPLLWFNIIFGSLATTEAALRRLGVTEKDRAVLLAPTAALTATSLDLVMDCFGLERGLWEWKLGGPYASDVRGVNRKRGIPLLNFLGWVTLVWAVVYLFQRLSGEAGDFCEETSAKRMEKVAILALVPYYLASLTWSIRSRRARFLLYSLAFPSLVLIALTAVE